MDPKAMRWAGLTFAIVIAVGSICYGIRWSTERRYERILAERREATILHEKLIQAHLDEILVLAERNAENVAEMQRTCICPTR